MDSTLQFHPLYTSSKIVVLTSDLHYKCMAFYPPPTKFNFYFNIYKLLIYETVKKGLVFLGVQNLSELLLIKQSLSY